MRPRRSAGLLASVTDRFALNRNELNILFVRGHYLDTLGAVGKDDINIYDDACFLFGATVLESYNANTNPSFIRRGGRALAQLDLGEYRFYRGLHRGKYKALRAWPEGVKLSCTREGKPSTCSHINIHKGSTNSRAHNVTWSEGCLTIPDTQYGDFIQRVYAAMERTGQETVKVLLLENRRTVEGQRLFDSEGRQVA